MRGEMATVCIAWVERVIVVTVPFGCVQWMASIACILLCIELYACKHALYIFDVNTHL